MDTPETRRTLGTHDTGQTIHIIQLRKLNKWAKCFENQTCLKCVVLHTLLNTIYSKTCIKRSPSGQILIDWLIDWCLTPTLAILQLYRGVGTKKKWPYKTKRLNSNEIFYARTGKGWPFNTGNCLIEVATWAGLTVYQG
jgi:hypothetical protein